MKKPPSGGGQREAARASEGNRSPWKDEAHFGSRQRRTEATALDTEEDLEVVKTTRGYALR
jgi:hypothetical protein